MAQGQKTPTKTVFLASVALIALGACADFDPDLRGISNGFDTSGAVRDMPNRPRPDARGVISYPTYQVVVARQNDTIRGIAIRLGLDVNELAAYNGIEPDVILRRDEVIALPTRLSDPAATANTVTGQPLDIAAVATGALDRAGASNTVVTATPLDPIAATAAPIAATPAQPEPIRHQVQRGETVFALSRLYNVPVRTIAEWNGLDSEFTVRTGQFLLIPQGQTGAPPPRPIEAPGAGSVTPVPPSAATPLPNETPSAPLPASATPPAPDLGAPSAASSARFSQPVQGSIFRGYAPGTNEGIDIAAPAGTDVKAADAGEVAAVTTNTSGVAIVVVKHSDGLLTVYTNIDRLTVNRGDTVSRGQTIGKIRASDPSFLHFEVRRGLQSVDPTDFLP
ncbi:MAG: peptidoglycan DD-metalloendopeptidase family protein [Yoonia sp.]|nr:peptidoglycan DD-metalloendopeptidase family protein [Yoonia sp.]MBE0412997.1 peptidoglycan DD-metalloendopeptidase family protein [Yoonia sp.]